MDASEVQRLIDDRLDGLQRAMQLQRWTIRAYAGSLHVIASLRHEILHIMHAPFETYRQAVRQLVHDDSAFNALDEVWTLACEQTVKNLEHMFDHGIRLSTDAMIERAKEAKREEIGGSTA